MSSIKEPNINGDSVRPPLNTLPTFPRPTDSPQQPLTRISFWLASTVFSQGPTTTIELVSIDTHARKCTMLESSSEISSDIVVCKYVSHHSLHPLQIDLVSTKAWSGRPTVKQANSWVSSPSRDLSSTVYQEVMPYCTAQSICGTGPYDAIKLLTASQLVEERWRSEFSVLSPIPANLGPRPVRPIETVSRG